MTQVRILNNVRKDNLFLSPSTWMQRNVLSGALINSAMEWRTSMRLLAHAGFEAGLGDLNVCRHTDGHGV